MELEAEVASVGLPELSGDDTTIGLFAALDWVAELPLFGPFIGFLGKRSHV